MSSSGLPSRAHRAAHGAARSWDLHGVGERIAGRIRRTAAAKIWTRLNAVDFLTSSTQFAALALLCLFPFLVVFGAATGVDVRPGLIRRLGLDAQAAHDVDVLMSQGSHAVSSLNLFGGVIIALGAMGIAQRQEPRVR